MPIPDQAVAGDSGHIQDHNDISDVLTDHESRVSQLETDSSDYLDTSATAQEKTGNLTLSGNVIVNNLTVTGTQTINNTETFAVADPIAYFGVGQWTEDAMDLGFIGAYGYVGGDEQNHYHTGLIRDYSDGGKWKLVSNIPHETGSEVTFTNATYDTLKLGAIEVSSSARVVNLNADKLDSQEGSYYLDWTNTTNKPSPTITVSGDASGSLTLTGLSGGTLEITVSDNSHNHTISNIEGLQTSLDLKASQSELTSHKNSTTSVHGIADTSLLATKSYVDTAESDAISAANSYSDSLASNYDPAGSASTSESNSNSYTDIQISTHNSDTNNVHGISDTSELATKTYADNAASAAVANIIDSAPETLDTLNELAAALGDDPNFATTITNNIASKAENVDLTSHENATTNIHGILDTSLLATTSYVDTAESDAVNSANAYSDSLSINYDPAGSATAAQTAAESYADSLAINYDPSGAAASAEVNAKEYTDSQIISVVGKIEHISRSTWTGTAVQSSVEASSVGILTVTFPAGKFSQVPKVFTQNIDDGSSSRMAYARFTPYSISTSSVSMQVINNAPPSTVPGGGSITKAIVDIMAVQESI